MTKEEFIDSLKPICMTAASAEEFFGNEVSVILFTDLAVAISQDWPTEKAVEQTDKVLEIKARLAASVFHDIVRQKGCDQLSYLTGKVIDTTNKIFNGIKG